MKKPKLTDNHFHPGLILGHAAKRTEQNRKESTHGHHYSYKTLYSSEAV